MKRVSLVLAAAVLGALVWLLWPSHEDEVGPAVARQPASPAVPSDPSKAETSKSNLPPKDEPPLEVSHLADALNSPAGNITADLHIVADVLENFRTNFAQQGNPVGSNAEITAALTGRNKLRYAPIPPNHPAINRDGELCDRWGTPFFFHAESASHMAIRSAGPDKKMWTDDDVVFEP